MGQFARCCASLQQCSGNKRVGEPDRLRPAKARIGESCPPFAAAAVESGSTPPACRPLKRNRKIPGIPERVPGSFRWGRFARCGAPLRQCAGREWRDKARLPAPGKSPNRGEFSTFCGSCCGKRKWLSGMPPIKADQLTPVLSAGTVRGRAGCVKSRSVQTFPHFAGLPVENRGRPGDRKNRLSQWNSRF